MIEVSHVVLSGRPGGALDIEVDVVLGKGGVGTPGMLTIHMDDRSKIKVRGVGGVRRDVPLGETAYGEAAEVLRDGQSLYEATDAFVTHVLSYIERVAPEVAGGR